MVKCIRTPSIQKKKQYLFVVKINNHHFWVNTKSIQCFSNAFFSNVRSNLALYCKLKTTIISRKGIWICNLRSFTKKPFCVKSVDIFGQRAVQDHIGTGTQIWSKNSLSLSVFFRKNVNCKKKKMAHSSLCNSHNNIQSH